MAPKCKSSDAGNASKLKKSRDALSISKNSGYGENTIKNRTLRLPGCMASEVMESKENVSLLYRLLSITLKRQNPLPSYVQEREKVHWKCTMYCTVRFIITLFNVGNVLLCVIY